ncbi:MAG: aminoglycoside phosphotransferase family protein [Actinomycetota bacterium]
MIIPERLARNCQKTEQRRLWLHALPGVVDELAQRWSITMGAPFDGPAVSCAWVAPAEARDGTMAVIKLGMPHFESDHEIEALRLLDGDPTVRLLASDEGLNAMLLERCVPGTHLSQLPETEQDVIIALMLQRFWREPPTHHSFRSLEDMTALWSDETRSSAGGWVDPGMVEEGLRLFQDLPKTAPERKLLATDLHAGNVLRAEREPWLVIDPKPFIGDPAYDATQHLLNCDDRMMRDPMGESPRVHRRLGVLTPARFAGVASVSFCA